MTEVRIRQDGGFTLIELLVSTALMAVVGAAVLSLLDPARGAFVAEPERADMQQRLRVAVDSLGSDLLLAGAGPYQGQTTGSLLGAFAPVLPFRQGLRSPDPPGTFRTDAITLVAVVPSASQTTVKLATPARSVSIEVNQDAGCQDVVCGFQPGTSALLYDDTGSFDLFTVVAVQGSMLSLRHDMTDSAKVYAAGSRLVQVTSRTFFLRTDAATGALQLARYDGGTAVDAPLVDHVTGLAFDYYGDPEPPVPLRPLTSTVGPWTSYGPKPPPVDSQTTGYPAGENCVMALDGEQKEVPRLGVLGAGGAGGLVQLGRAELTDGPWCPDRDSPNRFDADALRVRRVAVTLRVESVLRALRGPAGPLFSTAGSSRGGKWFAPDREIRFDVTPRNLNLGR